MKLQSSNSDNKNYFFGIQHVDLIFLLVISTIYILFLSPNISFLTYFKSNDESVWDIFAKSVIWGKQIPYTDIGDNKGVIHIWTYMLINVFGDGVISRLIVSFFLIISSLILFYKIINLFSGRFFTYFILLIECLFMSVTRISGIKCEDVSLPFLLLGIYFILRNNMNDDILKNEFKYTLLYGILVGVITYIRVNNSIIIVSMLFAISLILIKEKRIDLLIKHILYFVLGFAVVSLFVLSICYFGGYLQSMIDWSFLYNVKYLGQRQETHQSAANIYAKVHLLIPFIIYVCSYPFLKNKNNLDFFLFLASLGSFFYFFFGAGYIPYTLMFTPMYIIFICRYGLNLEKLLLISLMCVCPFLPIIIYQFKTALVLTFIQPYEESFTVYDRAFSIIPLEERHNNTLFYADGIITGLVDREDIYCRQKYIIFDPVMKIEFYENVLYDLLKLPENKWYISTGLEQNTELACYINENFTLVSRPQTMMEYGSSYTEKVNKYLHSTIVLVFPDIHIYKRNERIIKDNARLDNY